MARVAFFLSHCGNNGRLESIFYEVPLLCLPLFADQLFNSGHVVRRSLGMRLIKEDVISKGEKFFTGKVNEMLANVTKFKRNMATAKEAVVNDPGSGKSVFLYHINYLVKHGNVRYLKNSIIKKQSFIEVYNLDILLLFLLGLLLILMFVLISCIKLCRCICRRRRKSKTEWRINGWFRYNNFTSIAH